MKTYVICCNDMVMGVIQTDDEKAVTEHIAKLQKEDFNRNPWHWEQQTVRKLTGKAPFEFYKQIMYWHSNNVPLTVIKSKAK